MARITVRTITRQAIIKATVGWLQRQEIRAYSTKQALPRANIISIFRPDHQLLEAVCSSHRVPSGRLTISFSGITLNERRARLHLSSHNTHPLHAMSLRLCDLVQNLPASLEISVFILSRQTRCIAHVPLRRYSHPAVSQSAG